jgi:hypothetical protein
MPDLNEAKTRALLINPQLETAGWNLENLPALLHRWSKSRSAGRPHDNTGDGG